MCTNWLGVDTALLLTHRVTCPALPAATWPKHPRMAPFGILSHVAETSGVLPHNPAEPFLLPDRNTPTAMLDTPNLNELTQRLVNVVPADLRLIKGDLEKNVQAILQASFSRMNLVSREEFDVQRAVLARTREQLEALEQRVAELEQQILER